MTDRNPEQPLQVTVNSRHLNEPAQAKAYALEKFGRIGRFSPSLRTVTVMLQPEGMQFTCEATLIQDHHARIAVSMMSGDLNSAIDMAVERAERLLVREKERVSERRHRPSPKNGED